MIPSDFPRGPLLPMIALNRIYDGWTAHTTPAGEKFWACSPRRAAELMAIGGAEMIIEGCFDEELEAVAALARDSDIAMLIRQRTELMVKEAWKRGMLPD